MVRSYAVILPVAVLAACGGRRAAVAPPAPPTGDLLVVNARIHGAPAGADALLAERGIIRAVGPAAVLREKVPSTATLLDANGALVLPGFHDAHIHMLGGGLSLGQVDLFAATTMADTLKAVKAFADAHPALPWVQGRGWQYGIVPDGKFPTRADLDSVVPDRPVFLRAYDGHTGWANSAALNAAGITAETVDPPEGRIAREADGKTPEGALLEGAQGRMMEAVPAPDRAAKLAALERAARELRSLGMTSVDEIAPGAETFSLLDELDRRGRLPLRVTVSLPLNGDLAAYAVLRDAHRGPRVGFGFLKGFVDGVIESRMAWMLEPYAGSTERGTPALPPEKLDPLVERAHAAGFPVALHAIGDAAVRASLDAYEKAQRAHPAQHPRHRVEHIECVHPDDMPRFARLGVVASMQPFHANPGGPNPDEGVWSRNLGAARLPRTFAWKSLRDAGAVLAFGTDWPVMSANPLWGLAVAVTRRDANGDPKDGWNAHQALSWDDAVRAWTVGSAYAVSREEQVGTLEPGRWADLVVLSPGVDPGVPASLWRGRVVHAVVGGVVN
ncbi:MAG: amidohydrolase [Deltaproteobacteria bacterium]|nr:amidohydrolase [Deltaproteobacteria bacterium]